MNSSATSRFERLAPWLAGALLALPVLIARYPPMSDLPLHEAVVGLLRHWGDAAYVPPDVYELNLGQANQLFYFLILPLSYPFGVTWATKLVLSTTVLLLPVAFACTARHLGVSRFLAVALSPLGMGWMFFWGLLANLIGLVVFFVALPRLDLFSQKPTVRGFLEVCGWMILLHFAHESTALFAGGAMAVFTLARWSDARDNAIRLVTAAFPIGLAFVARMMALRLANARGRGLPPFVWLTFREKLVSLPGVIHGGFDWQVRCLIFGACLAPVLLFGIERWRRRDRAPRQWREHLSHFRFEILGLLLLLGYFLAPENIGPTTLVHQRFLAPGWALLVLCAGSRAPHDVPWRLPPIVATFVPIVPLLTCWPQFADSHRMYTELDEAIGHMDTGSSYLLLELGPVPTFLLYGPMTSGGHVVAHLGGRALFDSTDSLASPVHMRADRSWIHPFERIDQHPYRVMPPFDLQRFRYVILHTRLQSVGELVSLALQPEARVIFRSDEWTVLESTLPLLPLDTPDAFVPLPHPLTLRKRALAVIEAFEHAPPDDSSLPPDFVPKPSR